MSACRVITTPMVLWCQLRNSPIDCVSMHTLPCRAYRSDTTLWLRKPLLSLAACCYCSRSVRSSCSLHRAARPRFRICDRKNNVAGRLPGRSSAYRAPPMSKLPEPGMMSDQHELAEPAPTERKLTECKPAERKLTWALVAELLRTGQMTEADYLVHCRENGWPTDRLPEAPGGQPRTSATPSASARLFAVR
jgi:hypothetical protein